ncbi:MAG TPA: universal stress protein [Candidatus Limnocylindrales bacterium]|nr:universal stress protein [Candidatus Limnocylindrales bacterium]
MKILLAVDGSDASMSAVAATAALSMPADSTIEVVSVIPDSFAPEGSPWPHVIRVDPPTDRDRVHDDVARRLLDVADRVRTGETHTEVRVLDGRPATEIVTEAARIGADLIVMGARGLSAVRRLLLGSVSSEVVDHAPCPLLVARHAGVERVMLATDGSPGAASAADFIAESGLLDEARIRIISVVDPGMPWWTGISPVDGMTSIEVYADAVEIAKHRAQSAADKAAERLRERHVEDALALSDGDVVGTILDDAEAWRADVIVLGARDIGTVHRWLVGSVSRSVLHLAGASVLITRPRAAVAHPEEQAVAATA